MFLVDLRHLLTLKGVFTRLVEKLNVKDVQIDDLYSIDSDSLRLVGQIHGVVFLFKYGGIDRQYAKNGNAPLEGVYDEQYQDHQIFFANQTIQNACATQAVLNILLNKADDIDLGEDLQNFQTFVTGFDGEMAGETISNSDLIRSVHNSFSSPSLIVDEDPEKPPDNYDDKNDGLFHFIGYIMKNGFIYELDGLKSYPIKHQPCNSMEEFYEILPQILMQRIEKYNNELRFSLLVVTNDKLKYAQEIGDDEMVQQELMKRQTWDKEIELRKHDYTNLFVKIVKSLSEKKSDSEWQAILDKARQKTKDKISRQ